MRTLKYSPCPLCVVCILSTLSVTAFAQTLPPVPAPPATTRADAAPASPSRHPAQDVLDSIKINALPFYERVNQPGTTAEEAARISAENTTQDIARGEALLKSGDSNGAIGAFNQALAAEPHDGLAQQRLAEAYTAKGQTEQALATYRGLLYHVPHQHWVSINETSPTVLMHFALLLLQTGQEQEALAAYHRAVSILDAVGGGAHSLGVDLPYLGDGPGQVSYTPQTLQALAHLTIGIDSNGLDIWVAESKVAANLAPGLAVVQYYMGKSLYAVGRNQEARAAFERAIQLGDEQMAKEANVYLKMAR